MFNAISSLYMPSYPSVLVYMLQNTEYQVWPYLKWYWRTQNFHKVIVRRKLEKTKAARLLDLSIRLIIVVEILAGGFFIYLNQWHHTPGSLAFGLALIIGYPVVSAHLVALVIWLGRVVWIMPRDERQIEQSKQDFKNFKKPKIAVAGSYGKTSMKEMLLTVLSEGKKVAATPANKNVAVSHARFISSIKGDEDILIIEYGEDRPGDIEKFVRVTRPTHGIITGVAPAHLNHYKTLSAAGQDIFTLAKYLGGKHVYVNAESEAAREFIEGDYGLYDAGGALGWVVGDVKISLKGTSFTLKKGKKLLKLHSQLLGRHQLGPLSLAVALGEEFGLSDEQVEAGVGKTKPFEHRMNPYELNDAWIIDDTYNGNIEGIKAGAQLLKELKATRKWYVTPGLVDQGVETETVHREMGELIAGAGPDIAVLMQNSVTKFIKEGLEKAGFKGDLRIETDPLKFYTNLGDYLAADDLVLMQNDWPDNYA
ncbi:MAG TPA: Mur ligase family protein [Patescibacteria group bacterium]|jgi:UDP-N-acetylmuramoyl-tripeptide--D-alanyl-D-alanine ligase|nr:Mur ligase family protein [Patescibacteria group bacterium]